MPEPTGIRFFAAPREFREWLGQYHQSARELWVGFYKKGSGKPSITWPESVDEALCFGWIDGLRKSVDSQSYKIRFTPRRKVSAWSTINTRRMKELLREGRVHPAGMAAFRRRTADKSGVYAYENRKSAMLGR